jgi:hypothetical protein
LANGLGLYDSALDAVREVGERSDQMGSLTRATPELIEASARCGELDVAERALERLGEMARATGTNWALGVEARSRALLSDGEAAEGNYREAIERLASTRVRVELARAHLLCGEWLRRERRRLDAREQLRTAHQMFTTMGVEAFAGRADMSCWQPASGSASAGRRRETSSRRRRPRSRGSLGMASRTPRSARGCSSAGAPSSTTSARYSPS